MQAALRQNLQALLDKVEVPTVAVGTIRVEGSTLLAHIHGEAAPRRFGNLTVVSGGGCGCPPFKTSSSSTEALLPAVSPVSSAAPNRWGSHCMLVCGSVPVYLLCQDAQLGKATLQGTFSCTLTLCRCGFSLLLTGCAPGQGL